MLRLRKGGGKCVPSAGLEPVPPRPQPGFAPGRRALHRPKAKRPFQRNLVQAARVTTDFRARPAQPGPGIVFECRGNTSCYQNAARNQRAPAGETDPLFARPWKTFAVDKGPRMIAGRFRYRTGEDGSVFHTNPQRKLVPAIARSDSRPAQWAGDLACESG
jgi:hypothetical protein